MDEPKITSEEDEIIETNEEVYYLCPVCSTDEKPYGEINMFELAGHFNRTHSNKKTGGGGEKWDDFKSMVQKSGDKPLNLIQREKKKKKSKPKQNEKGVKMSGENDPDSEIAAELGEAAALKGRIRGLIKEWAKLEDNDRNSLLSEREQLIEFMRILSSRKEMPEDIVREIEGKIDSEIEPVIKSYTDPDSNKPPEEKGSDKTTTDIKMKGQKLRSKIKSDLASIANLPSKYQDEIIAEKDLLIELNGRLCKDGITKADLQDIEASYSGNHPFIEGIVNKGKKKGKHKDDWDDDDDDEDEWDELERADIKEAIREEKLLKHRVRLEESKQRLAELKSTSPTHPGTIPPQVGQRPRIDPDTGQIMTDENGNAVMEHYYIQQGATGDSMAMTLLTAVLPTLVGNARGSSHGPTTEEIELRLQNERLSFEKTLLERDQNRGGNNESSNEIRELRLQMQQQQQQFHQEQLTRMERDIEKYQRAASQDPLDELFYQKNKLIQLGLVQDSQAAAENEQTKYANRVLQETKGIVERSTSEIKEMMEPLAEIGRDDMRITLDQKRARLARESQSEGSSQETLPPNQPRKLTEEQRRHAWNKLYHAVEDEEEL